ncbi:hypothetical protein RUM44_013043 [Polyplax serrata]|uniref:BZIP domain-containing protein n=1 Tax=Polyplax serrata TaxID=468196 RepID=A0ABR1BH05_POLSC
MESLAPGMSTECLVTDLVNELSSGLEVPFLLRDDISLMEKQNPILLHDDLYKEETCLDSLPFSLIENNKTSFYVKTGRNYELGRYWQNNDVDIHSISQLSQGNNGSNSSGSGSSSECSSTEMWTIKNEYDTPPITPPDERISPENTFLLPIDELKFTSTNSDDTQAPGMICNIIGDLNSNIVDSKVDSNIFLSCGKLGKKSVSTKRDLELQARRKQERMIRNRESAYLSRKRKKEHVAHLEKQVQDLITENSHLRLENYSLKQRLAIYEEVDFPALKKSQNIFTNSTAKTTALFALLFTFCINFGSLSSLLNEVKWNKNEILGDNMASFYTNKIRHSRSLLWTNSEIKFDANSTMGNSTIPSCPAFINQSESIRLESELRRWIGTEDDYSASFSYNISNNSENFSLRNKPKVKKQLLKIKNKSMASKIKNNLEMDMYKLKSNLFNINTFFESINRRDDTFYLVSGDHLLLPALSHNKTSRPKMSLMLTAFLSNVTGTTSDQVEMMQIDCEVINTQVLSVNELYIPTHMRPYTNSTRKLKGNSREKSQKFKDFLYNQDNFLTQREPKNQNQEFSMKRMKRMIRRTGLPKFKKTHLSNNVTSSAGKGVQGKEKYVKNVYEDKPQNSILSNDSYKESPVDFITNKLKGIKIKSNTKAIEANKTKEVKAHLIHY